MDWIFRSDLGDHPHDRIPVDWRGRDALYLAVMILWRFHCDFDGDAPERFANEVILKLPDEGWELSEAEVHRWNAPHAKKSPEQIRAALGRTLLGVRRRDRTIRMFAKLRELGCVDEHYQIVKDTEDDSSKQ